MSNATIMLQRIVQIILVIFVINAMGEAQYHRAKMIQRRNRITERRLNIQNKLKPQVCYEFVGCFADPPPSLSLKRPPERPEIINTRFVLYTRNRSQAPEILMYGDNLSSIRKSSFDSNKNVKVIIHGFKGSGNDVGVINGARSFLEVEDTNVIILDWERGAGTSYGVAVANVELVGRQLSLVLMDAIKLGTSPKNFHIVGFSLGAHVAGCASEMLKKNNILVERITGLDPASPFFKNHLIRQRSKKLDISDAHFVDIIHTDGSETLVDGFGLLKPMGHVDFFPNGGREQPGCTDVKNSVVVSHLSEESLDGNIACSHLRAWKLFVESIQSQLRKCKFLAWPCRHGAAAYFGGNCFPDNETLLSQEMGYQTNFENRGIFYLATRAEEPFCGEVVRASVTISADAGTHTSGILYLDIEIKNSITSFGIGCDIGKNVDGQLKFSNIAAVNFGALAGNSTSVIQGTMQYAIITENRNETSTTRPFDVNLKVNTVSIEDRWGNRWEYHGSGIVVSDIEPVNVQLYTSMNQSGNRK